jgi:UDP-3-O-[3-hydroxymyristoyl] glucosamine N-acyltransferase
MKGRRLGDLAEQIGGELTGDPATLIQAVSSIDSACDGSIVVVKEARFLRAAETCAATAVVVARDAALVRGNVVRVDDPRRAFIRLLEIFSSTPKRRGVDRRAVVDPSAALGADVYLGPCACIESGVVIGDRSAIHANCFIGEGVHIGSDCTLHANVCVYAGATIGDRVVVHSGTVIGSDGFGYMQNERGEHEKVPQLGSVTIDDDVEIGANCAIDRGTLEPTHIGRGTKIDNLVQIGHNSDVGEHCCIIGQAGLAGSVRVGRNSFIAGQAGIADHVTIGERVTIGAQCGVHGNIAADSGRWLGTPALPAAKAGRMHAALPHFPEYRERIRALEQRVADLVARLEGRGATVSSAEPPDDDASHGS